MSLFGTAGQGMKFAAPIQMQNAETAQMQNNLHESMQKQQAQALAAQLMSKMSQPQSGPAVPGMSPLPGQTPGGAAPAGGAVAPSLPPSGGAGATQPSSPSTGGFSPEKAIDAISKSNAPDVIKFQALQQMMGVMNPYEKMQAQQVMRQMQIDNQQSMLSQRLDELAREKDQWAKVTTRGQDTRSNDQAANRGSREAIADKNIGARESIAAQGNATRKEIASTRPGATSDPATQAIEKQLQNSRTLLTTMLNNFKGPGNKDYDVEKKKYESLQQELEGKRNKATTSAPAAGKPLAEDVAYLKAHPEQKANFEAHFGPGSADAVLGQ